MRFFFQGCRAGAAVIWEAAPDPFVDTNDFAKFTESWADFSETSARYDATKRDCYK